MEFTISPTVHEASLFSMSSLTLVICCLLEGSHSDRCEVASYWDLIFISLMINDVDIFSYVCWLYIFFGKMSLWVSVHILLGFVFDVELSEFFVCVGN